MDIRSARSLITREVHDFGLGPTLYDLFFRTVNHVVPFTIWNAVVVDKPHADFLKLPDGYEARLLDADAMLAYARPENDLDEPMVEQARENGDRCMALFDRCTLASYGWYSSKPTDLTEELRLRFNERYTYMYKGFTNNNYRGQRLHALGMTLALQQYLRRGYLGIVSVVASHNFSSLKSCYRMGYRDFGKICAVKVLGRYFLFHSRGCQRYDFAVEPRPMAQERGRSVVEAA